LRAAAEQLGDIWTVPTDDPDQQNPDLLFAEQHWTEIGPGADGGTLYRCDYFDPQSRTCTAHDQRPDICRNFPWYGAEPNAWAASQVHPRCSYLLDLPAADRPPGARPLIPIEVLR
jgi:Fe-S-cluster containining protein